MQAVIKANVILSFHFCIYFLHNKQQDFLVLNKFLTDSQSIYIFSLLWQVV